MSAATTFHWDAIKWLRDEAGLATEVRPADRIEDPNAPLLIQGFWVRPSRAGALAYASLWVFTVALLLAMLGMPGVAEETEAILHGVGQAGLGVAALMLAVAWVVSRRSRSPAVVQLHPAAAPATVDAITSLRRDAREASTWIVTERTPAPEVLAAAAELGVRCFGRGGRGGAFAPLTDAAARAPRGTPAPPDSAP